MSINTQGDMIQGMAANAFLGNEFTAMVKSACAEARIKALKAGVSVFYRDFEEGIDVLEEPDGRRFEICFVPGKPPDQNYKVMREIGKTAA